MRLLVFSLASQPKQLCCAITGFQCGSGAYKFAHLLSEADCRANSRPVSARIPLLLMLLLLLFVGGSLSALAQSGQSVTPQAAPEAPAQSEALKNSKDKDFILRNFKTMFVDAGAASFFGNDQMKAALVRNEGFDALNIRMVDDPKVADVVLMVGYTFAWDYPFELRHQNTTMVLLAGKGIGPFSGPLGAASVADEFVALAKRYRALLEKKDR